MDGVTSVRLETRTAMALASLGTTFLRLAIAVGIAIALVLAAPRAGILAAAGIVAIMAFDYMDGILFRRSPLSSSPSWRIRQRLTDSAVDRMVIQVVCLSVLAVNHNFWPLYACILAKEAVFWIIGTSVFLKGLVVFPGRWAKMGMVLLGASVALYSVGLTQAAIVAMGLMVALAFIALLEYRQNYRYFLSGDESIAIDPHSAPVLRIN